MLSCQTKYNKQNTTAEPDLITEPATKLTDILMAETVHGHVLIHGQSVNPGPTVAPLGERRILVTAAPLRAPRKGDLKG